MENLDLNQLSQLSEVIAEEKNLPKEVVLDIVEQGIAAAWRKENGDRDMDVRASLNTKTGEAKVIISRTVVEDDAEDFNPANMVREKDAGGKKPGEIVEETEKVTSLGRVAAGTAKQVIIQRLRDAEGEVVLSSFEGRVGEVMTGQVSRIEPRLVRIDLGRASGIMPRSEQVEGERYTVGERLKVYLKKIDRDERRGASLILSRACPEFVDYLFRQEVPELETGAVEIRGIAREAGRRTKIAVASTVPGIDPVGTFVGTRGVRVQAVTSEIGEREKIDIVNWSDNPSEYIREALAPAEINRVEIDGKTAKVFVNEDQQSLAIGRQGQNVRLASRLTGYDLDIEVAKAAPKKKRVNAEDSLLSALEEAGTDSEN